MQSSLLLCSVLLNIVGVATRITTSVVALDTRLHGASTRQMRSMCQRLSSMHLGGIRNTLGIMDTHDSLHLTYLGSGMVGSDKGKCASAVQLRHTL